jgi:LmbE family N-acetylglucosaminyl deacetylase
VASRIVSIHAHPDDAEILAGGTLSLLAQAGHEITIVTMTPGDCGSGELGPDEIAAVRRGEAASAAALIGAEYHCAEFRDLSIFNDDPSRRRVTEVLRKIRPDVVLTASPEDYLCDHEATSQLVRDACFAASAPNYSSGIGKPLDRIPYLYFMDPIEFLDRAGRRIVPHFMVNVESTMDSKKAMLSKHESQRSWLKRQHDVDDYVEKMEGWTRARGLDAGVAYGEGFRQYSIHPYPQAGILQDILARFVLPVRVSRFGGS